MRLGCVVVAFFLSYPGLSYPGPTYCGNILSNNEWSDIISRTPGDSAAAAEIGRELVGKNGRFHDLYNIGELYSEGGLGEKAAVFFKAANALAERYQCSEADEYFDIRFAEVLFESGEIEGALLRLLKVEEWLCVNSVERIEIMDGDKLFVQDNDVRAQAEHLRARLSEIRPNEIRPAIQCPKLLP